MEMIWLLIILLILLFLFILIIFTRLTIYINYFHHNGNDDLKIEFRIWFGSIKYKLNVPLIKVDDDSPGLIIKRTSNMGDSPTTAEKSEHKVDHIDKGDLIANMKNMKELLHHVFNLHVIVRKFFKKVTIKQFDWHSLIGVGDAAQTGVVSGALWAIKGGLIGLLSHYIKLKKMPNLTVTPHFQVHSIQTRLSCIFQFRIGHAILAGIKLIKFWKGGRPHFKTSTSISK
jgi:hypothetical protein